MLAHVTKGVPYEVAEFAKNSEPVGLRRRKILHLPLHLNSHL
jgi:hypothetical protein